MTTEAHHVSDELDDHKSKVETWMQDVSSMNPTSSRKGVNERFVNDCKAFIGYLDGTEAPSSQDLCDFGDRTAALEVQYHNITEANS